MAHAQGICGCCGLPGQYIYYVGLRSTCYRRWLAAGKPADGPPPRQLSRAERIAEYELLRGTASVDEIADRLGVQVDTVHSYAAELKMRANYSSKEK